MSRYPLQATRTPAGGRASGGPPPAVRYAAQPIWPGITTGYNALCLCTWAMFQGVYQVKYASAMCAVAGHARSSRG